MRRARVPHGAETQGHFSDRSSGDLPDDEVTLREDDHACLRLDLGFVLEAVHAFAQPLELIQLVCVDLSAPALERHAVTSALHQTHAGVQYVAGDASEEPHYRLPVPMT